MGLLLQRVLHHLLVLPAVGLGPQGPYGGPLAPVQHPVLDTGPVGGLCHLAPQGVQLPHQMALAGAADGGVAGHVAHRVQIDGKAYRLQSQPGGGQRRLDAGVARADDGNIKLSRNKLFHTRPSRQADEIRYSIIKYLLSKCKRDCAFCQKVPKENWQKCIKQHLQKGRQAHIIPVETIEKERSVIGTMWNNFITGDLDDMIFADCDWQPSER